MWALLRGAVHVSVMPRLEADTMVGQEGAPGRAVMEREAGKPEIRLESQAVLWLSPGSGRKDRTDPSLWLREDAGGPSCVQP